MEVEFTAQVTTKTPLSVDLNVQSVEERSTSSPKDTSSSTLVLWPIVFNPSSTHIFSLLEI